MKKIFFIFFLLLFGCGYQAINNLENSNYIISSYDLSGDPKINKILKRNFDRHKQKSSDKNFDLIVQSNLDKSDNIKNKAGEVTNYTLEISIDLEVLNNGEIIKDQSFKKNTSYNNNGNKFELKQYEQIVIKNLTDNLLKQIHIVLSSIK